MRAFSMSQMLAARMRHMLIPGGGTSALCDDAGMTGLPEMVAQAVAALGLDASRLRSAYEFLMLPVNFCHAAGLNARTSRRAMLSCFESRTATTGADAPTSTQLPSPEQLAFRQSKFIYRD